MIIALIILSVLNLVLLYLAISYLGHRLDLIDRAMEDQTEALDDIESYLREIKYLIEDRKND